MNFEEKLKFGKISELKIEKYFYENGYNIILTNEYTGRDNNKAPQLFNIIKNLTLPDLDISKGGKRFWVEVKHYTTAPLNRKYNIYVHGIKKRHYDDYLLVEKSTGSPVYLYIDEEESKKILWAELIKLKTYPCLFPHEHNDQCLIYFDRNDFNALH
ncbi:MAG: hypothetical protein ABII94_03080 [Patescibacteria group bacterium]